VDLISKALREAKREGSLIGLHTDRDAPTRFTLGWIVDVNTVAYLLAAIAEDGGPDQLVLGLVEDIVYLSLKGPYIEGYTSIARHDIGHLATEYPIVSASMDEILRWAQESETILEIEDRLGELHYAQVLAADETTIRFASYLRPGKLEGESVLRKQDVMLLKIGGSVLRMMQRPLPTEAPSRMADSAGS
jgi:hypothetical protein